MVTATNWKSLLSDSTSTAVVKNFATGTLSGRSFYNSFRNTSLGGEVRTLLRSGVGRAREISRKALRRRGLL